MFETGEPRTREEILSAMEALHRESDGFLANLPTSVFLRPQGEKWSPADHVRHLAKSSRAVTGGLGMPKPVLFLLFGPKRGGSRSFSGMREAYRTRLAAGADAGRFTPSPHADDGDPEAWRKRVVASWYAASEELSRAALRWSEPALDRYRMPHPLLGKLSVREMLLFTLYHSAHHVRLVAGRVAEG